MSSDQTIKTEGADPAPEGIDRRKFLAGTAAVSIAVTVPGLLACNDTSAEAVPPKVEEKQPDPPKAAEKPAVEEKPAAEADKNKPPVEEVPPAEPVQEKSFPMKAPGKLVQVTHPGATTDIKKTDEAIVAKMVEEALKKLTGEADGVKAIGRFIKKEDIVGIKVNCLGSPYASVHPATAYALAELVHKLGVAKKDIIIYDQYGSRMQKAGFKTLPKDAKDPVDKFPVHFHETMGYETERVDLGGFNKNNDKPYSSQLPKVLARFTAVINVCVPKDHDLTGVTGALKNVSYGNVERVPIYHCKPDCNPTCVHGGMCNVSRIYKHEKMGGLVRLVVCDALRVLFQGGPQDNMTFKAAHNAILASTDPVAIDRAILTIVDEYRATRKLKPIAEDQGGRRAARFIEAGEKLGLGVSDLAKIKWEKHTMG